MNPSLFSRRLLRASRVLPSLAQARLGVATASGTATGPGGTATYWPCLLVLFLLWSGCLGVQAQVPTWQMATAVAPPTTLAGYSAVQAAAADGNGNLYLAGVFQGTVSFGSTTFTSPTNPDVFVAKWSPATRGFVWAQRAGGGYSDYVSGIAVNGANVYITGGYQVSASFGTTTFPPPTIYFTDRSFVYVAKLADAGSSARFVWAQSAGSSDNNEAGGLAVSGNQLYITGAFNQNATFGYSSYATFGAFRVSTSGYKSGFVAKLTDAGASASFTWAEPGGGPGTGVAHVAVNGVSVYLTGAFDRARATFGAVTLANADASGSTYTSSDVFLAKLTDHGTSATYAWAERAGGPGYDRGRALAVNGSNVYLAGEFSGTMAMPHATVLTSAGSEDVFVAKYVDAGATGSHEWAQRAGGSGSDTPAALAVQGTSLYVGGEFSGSTAAFGNTTLRGAGASDAFVARLTDAGVSGSFAWAQQAGGPGYDALRSVVVQGTAVYAAGVMTPVASFGTQSIAGLSTAGFLASLGNSALSAAVGLRRAGPHLFPNPAHRTATLRLPVGATAAPLVLTNALGRAVRRYPAPAGPEAALDLQGLPAGLYLLRGAGLPQRLVIE
ncbi:T9SS type A sorting domain-containing protein [Hymenobacter sp. BT683]|uniref:T9SS type A sorting domain-containing protein n=1 Tax=Hymenobacter jeongseonensis TaxID=2791027 RepID=A0ABS0IQ68_9BACT|nr:T9SS type A sorting domain-containing protein [Hymenobacter jeongseonensis]MBF9239900.1 T9SS type A sorting domain-containing protein [Hymenobacter jeongseonensis]